ncbi:MAG: hypothetical protein GQ544_08065 [Candidatus Aminicenantes bacterium]|nr:hypothetical protein [Candidatus Aminicenantes bacterium]
MNSLLIHSARLAPTSLDLSIIEEALSTNLDWDVLLKRAGEEGVAPLLYQNLKSFSEHVPASQWACLKRIYVRNTARNLYIYKKILPLLEMMSKKDVRVAVTRGARLSETVYRDWGLRYYVDVDFMVHPDDAAQLVDILKTLGYLQDSHASRFPKQKQSQLHWTIESGFQKDGVFLDFHFNYPGVEIPLDAFPEIWETRLSMQIFETKARIFSPEYELCILCLHAQKHCYQRIIWLTDIAELAQDEDLNWDKVFAICQDQDISAPVYYGLFLVNQFWPESIAPPVLKQLNPGRISLRILHAAWPDKKVISRELKEEIPGHAAVLFLFFSGKRLGLKLKTLFATTFPPRAYVSYFYQIPVNSIKMLSHYTWRVWRPFSLLIRMLRKNNG